MQPVDADTRTRGRASGIIFRIKDIACRKARCSLVKRGDDVAKRGNRRNKGRGSKKKERYRKRRGGSGWCDEDAAVADGGDDGVRRNEFITL